MAPVPLSASASSLQSVIHLLKLNPVLKVMLHRETYKIGIVPSMLQMIRPILQELGKTSKNTAVR